MKPAFLPLSPLPIFDGFEDGYPGFRLEFGQPAGAAVAAVAAAHDHVIVFLADLLMPLEEVLLKGRHFKPAQPCRCGETLHVTHNFFTYPQNRSCLFCVRPGIPALPQIRFPSARLQHDAGIRHGKPPFSPSEHGGSNRPSAMSRSSSTMCEIRQAASASASRSQGLLPRAP